MRSVVTQTEIEDLFEILSSNLPVGVCIIQDEKFLYINPNFLIYTGYREDELLGKDFLTIVIPEDREMARENATKMLKEEPASPYQFRVACKDGSSKWVTGAVRSVQYHGREAILAIYRDITERKQAEEALCESEERYRKLANSITDVFFAMDYNLRYTYWNKASEILTGIREEAVLGKSLQEIFPDTPEIRKAEKVYRDVLRTQQSQTFVTDYTAHDGRHYIFEISAYPSRNGISVFVRDVTERKQAEEGIRVFSDTIASSINAVAIADLEGNVTHVNKSFLRMWGYDDEKEILGKSAVEFWQVAEEAVGVMQKTLNKEGWVDELVAKRKDGSNFDVLLSASVVRDEAGRPICRSGSFVDITERKRTEEALRQSEENYRALFDSAVIGTIVLDAETMKVLIANQAAAKIFGFSSVEEALESDPFDFILLEDKERVSELAEKALFEQNAQLTYDLRILTKDGRQRWISATGARIVHQGRLAGLISFTDITKQKRQSEQLMLADRLASIGELAAGAAHELNNPLTSVIGFSQLLMDKDIPDDIREDLEIIYSEAQRAAGVTKNLLAFARKHRPVKQLNQINSIIEDVLKLRTYEHKIKGIEVEKQLASDLPENMVDHFQLQQVFFNIVINAEYFMTEAHDRGTLTITTENHNGTMRISFADDGPGIPLENLSQIFNPFFTTKQTGKGTGLGLSICHGVVSEHRGQIYAKSQPGEGTTIFVELPINGHRQC